MADRQGLLEILLTIFPIERNQHLIIERRSLPFTQQSPEQYRDWKGYQGLFTSMELSWNPVYYPEVLSAV